MLLGGYVRQIAVARSSARWNSGTAEHTGPLTAGGAGMVAARAARATRTAGALGVNSTGGTTTATQRTSAGAAVGCAPGGPVLLSLQGSKWHGTLDGGLLHAGSPVLTAPAAVIAAAAEAMAATALRADTTARATTAGRTRPRPWQQVGPLPAQSADMLVQCWRDAVEYCPLIFSQQPPAPLGACPQSTTRGFSRPCPPSWPRPSAAAAAAGRPPLPSATRSGRPSTPSWSAWRPSWTAPRWARPAAGRGAEAAPAGWWKLHAACLGVATKSLLVVLLAPTVQLCACWRAEAAAWRGGGQGAQRQRPAGARA